MIHAMHFLNWLFQFYGQISVGTSPPPGKILLKPSPWLPQRRTIINGIYSFYVSVICLSCTLFCAYRLIWTSTAIFDFLPFFALFPGVLGFYGRRTIIDGIYSFYVSVICLSCTLFCAYRLIWTGTAIFDFSPFFALSCPFFALLSLRPFG
jgi:hypothetical protein